RAVGCSEQASIRPASRPQHSFGSSATACAIISCPIRRGNCKRNGVDKTAFTSEVNTFPFAGGQVPPPPAVFVYTPLSLAQRDRAWPGTKSFLRIAVGSIPR